MKRFLHIFKGSDGEYSLRRLMAVAVLLGLIRHTEKCPENAEVAFVFASLIGALLALTTIQNINDKKKGDE